jgi:hypothetical protein
MPNALMNNRRPCFAARNQTRWHQAGKTILEQRAPSFWNGKASTIPARLLAIGNSVFQPALGILQEMD